MTRITRALATVALAILAPIGMLATTGSADASTTVRAGHSVRLDAPITPGAHHAKRVVDWHRAHHGHAVVTFRDGSRWNFSPCQHEDSRNCYWDARHRGNGVGHSLVNLRGHVHYLHR